MKWGGAGERRRILGFPPPTPLYHPRRSTAVVTVTSRWSAPAVGQPPPVGQSPPLLVVPAVASLLSSFFVAPPRHRCTGHLPNPALPAPPVPPPRPHRCQLLPFPPPAISPSALPSLNADAVWHLSPAACGDRPCRRASRRGEPLPCASASSAPPSFVATWLPAAVLAAAAVAATAAMAGLRARAHPPPARPVAARRVRPRRPPPRWPRAVVVAKGVGERPARGRRPRPAPPPRHPTWRSLARRRRCSSTLARTCRRWCPPGGLPTPASCVLRRIRQWRQNCWRRPYPGTRAASLSSPRRWWGRRHQEASRVGECGASTPTASAGGRRRLPST